MNLLATVPAEITTAFTDLDTVVTAVKALAVSFGIFFIVWALFTKGSRRATK